MGQNFHICMKKNDDVLLDPDSEALYRFTQPNWRYFMKKNENVLLDPDSEDCVALPNLTEDILWRKTLMSTWTPILRHCAPPPLTVRLTVKYFYFYYFPNMFEICVRFASSKHKVFVPVHICICLVLLCRRAQGHQDCGWVTFCYKVWQHRCSVCEKYFKHSLCHHAITCGDMGQHVLFLQFFLGYIICNLQFILQCYSNFRRHLFENLKKR